MSMLVVPFCTRSPKMLPLSVALPDTVKLPTMSTRPGLIVITVVPPMFARMLPPDAITARLDVPLAMVVVSTEAASIVAGVVPLGPKKPMVLPDVFLITVLPRVIELPLK